MDEHGGDGSYGENGNYGESGGGVTELTAAQRAAKECGVSPCFLAAAVAYTVNAVLYVLTNLGGSPGPGVWPFAEDYHALFRGVHIVTTLMSVVQLAVLALTGAGMWIFFVDCKKAGVPSVRGLKAARAGVLISLVLGVAGCLVSAGICIWVLSGTGYAGRNVLWETLTDLFLLAALLVFYYVKALKCEGVVRGICQTGWPKKKLPTSLAVMNFILAGLTLFGLLELPAWEDPGVLYLAEQISQAVSGICAGICILTLRGRLLAGV